MPITRRDALLAMLAAPLAAPWLTSCRDTPAPSPPVPAAHGLAPVAPREAQRHNPPAPPAAWELMDFPPSEARRLPQKALVRGAAPGPLLVLLHGRGETRSLDIGARGWRDDYLLERAFGRLAAPPLTSADLEGFVTVERLRALNAALAARPFRGLGVACPFTPDLIRGPAEETEPFARFVIEELLPRARPGGAGPAEAGIDGVSLGGRVALFVGLRHPEVFGAVGAMQPALQRSEVPVVVELIKRAQQVRPQRLRLMTSEGDPFRPVVEALSEALEQAGVPHTPLVTPGPHDYAWNRGPGSVETLLWYDRALRGEAHL